MARRSLMSLCVVVCLHLAPAARAQLCGVSPDMLIVLDRSGSMDATKWPAARAAVNSLVATYKGQINFGLLLFPFPTNCYTSGPVVAVGPATQTAISLAMTANTPTNYCNTPMGSALQEANNYLAYTGGKNKFVLLITDGCETCSGSPGSAVAALYAKGIKTFVVGFGSGIVTCSGALTSMATAGGTSTVYKANDQTQLTAALKSIAGKISCCGNGKLDSGESCDTAIPVGSAGACPLTCNDNNACTSDSLGGLKCATKCSHTPITQPKSGDGCCPPGASSLSDSDCKIVCGNGLLESGELCDPGISAGPGTCKTLADCNDGNVCTADNIGGSQCQRACVYTTKTANLVVKDGCCPLGATSKTDLDCKVICGNGLLEAGESCDPAITSGAGKCPTLADCDDGNTCTADSLSGSACNLKCKSAAVQPGASQKDGCCPPGANAITDADCAPVCGNGVLEAPEKCDPKIVSGAGACPSLADCDDKDKCTTDGLSGSGCNVLCTHTKLTANPSTKDGCCPPGANSLSDLDCAAVCGNGVLEAGEACDPGITSGAGTCKTLSNCDDGNACTADALAGSGCNVTCTHTTLGASLAKTDGCCPKGASSLTDKDCPAGCGNGVLEAGETCDPKIVSGKGACPTLADCDDLDPCTLDSLSGGACTLTCKNSLIPANPTKKDGCCPSGATSLSDKDCLPVCGNGLLEAGESCDTGITSGAGKCKTLADCDDGDKCTVDTLIGSGCSSTCKSTKVAPDPHKKDGCCPAGHSQKTDADCLPRCGPDRTTGCIDLCKGVKCPAGFYCKDGKCYPGKTNSDGGTTHFDEAGMPIPGDGARRGDGARGRDAGSSGDIGAGGPGGGVGASATPDEGCACAMDGGRSAPPLLLLLLALLWCRGPRLPIKP